MIRKILLFTILTCIALPAHAQTDRYCISSAKLTEMHNEQSTQNPDIQRAYNALFEILVANNESGTKDNAGCITQQDLAQICKDALNDDDEMCELFIYAVMTPAKQSAFKILQYSGILNKTNFDDINPDAFKQAVNKTLARRRDKQIPSKLQDMGPAFLENAKLKQIDPFIAAAISMYESTYGTSSKARNLNNIAGLQGAGGYIKFPTVPDSIASQAATISKLSYTKNLTSLANSGHYCAKSVAPKWAADVRSIAMVLYRNYNSIVQGKK